MALINRLRLAGYTLGGVVGILTIAWLVMSAIAAANSGDTVTDSHHIKSCWDFILNTTTLTPNTNCSDGNQCTADFTVGNTNSCTNIQLVNGAPCNSICFVQNETQNCQNGVCTGSCAGACSNTSDPSYCESIMPFPSQTIINYLENSTTGLEYGSFCSLGGQCLTFLFDIGFNRSDNDTSQLVNYTLPALIGWPDQANNDACLSLLDNTNPNIECINALYFFVPAIPNANYTFTFIYAQGLMPPNDIFVCQYTYNCGGEILIPQLSLSGQKQQPEPQQKRTIVNNNNSNRLTSFMK